jgi:hypothetical protein
MTGLKNDFRRELELFAGYAGSVFAEIDLEGLKISLDRKAWGFGGLDILIKERIKERLEGKISIS